MKKIFFFLIGFVKVFAVEYPLLDWMQKEVEGDAALRMGIPRLAENYYDEILQEQLSPLLTQKFFLKKITTQIAQNKIKQASSSLLSIPEPQDPVAILLGKIIQFLKDPNQALEYPVDIESINILPEKWKYWGYLYQYFVLIQQGKYELAQEREDNLKNYTGPIDIDGIEPIFRQNRLLYGSPDPGQGEILKTLIKEFSGTDSGYEYVRYFAIYQFRIGNRKEARQTLFDFLLSEEDIPQKVKDQFYYTIAVMAESGNKDRTDSWSFIIRDGKSAKPLLYCLSQIRNSVLSNDQTDLLLKSIKTRLDKNVRIIPKSQWIRTKASLHWKNKDWDALAKDAEELLESNENERIKREAYYWQAYLSLKRSPKQYGNATIAFANLLEKLPEGDERQQIRLQLADCFFQNKNYQDAAKMYKESQDFSPEEILPRIIYHQIFCEIKSKNFEWVDENLYSQLLLGLIENSSIWELELEFWKALNIHNVDKLSKRIDKVWGEFKKKSALIDNNIKAKIYLYFSNFLKNNKNDYRVSLELINKLIVELKKTPNFKLENFQSGSDILLLKGELELMTSPLESSLSTLKEVRALFPKSDQAILSYILESRFWSDQGRSVDAQNILNKLVENFPNSNFAPIALYEAALQSSTRGSLEKEKDAIQLSEKIVAEYPKHPLHSYALLQQAELLWRNGNLDYAKNKYRKILDDYPDHLEKTAIRLAIAKILMAQKSENQNNLNQAMTIFESISKENDLTPALEIEIKISWALAHRNLGQLKDAEKLYLEPLVEYLLNAEKMESNDILWWLGKLVVSFGELYKEMGKDGDAIKVYQLVEKYDLPQKLLAKTMLNTLSGR